MTVYSWASYGTGTDLGATTGFTRQTGNSGSIAVNASKNLDFVTTTPVSLYTCTEGGPNHSFEVTSAQGTWGGNFYPMCVRVTDVNNMFCARITAAANLELAKYVAGTPTTLGSVAITGRATGDKWRLEALGNVISVYYKDVLQIQVTDSFNNTATLMGMFGRSSTATNTISSAKSLQLGITIDSINGGSSITVGQTGIPSTSTGYSGLPTAITTNAAGVTCSNIGGATNAPTFTISDRVDGGFYPKSGTSVSFTFTRSTEIASASQTIVKKSTETAVVISSPFLSLNTIGNALLLQAGRTIVTGDEFYHTTYSDLVITPDSDFTVTAAGSFDLWLYVSSGADAGKNFNYSVTITESGSVIVTSKFIGSTIKGSLLAGSILKGKLL